MAKDCLPYMDQLGHGKATRWQPSHFLHFHMHAAKRRAIHHYNSAILQALLPLLARRLGLMVFQPLR